MPSNEALWRTIGSIETDVQTIKNLQQEFKEDLVRHNDIVLTAIKENSKSINTVKNEFTVIKGAVAGVSGVLTTCLAYLDHIKQFFHFKG